MANQPPLRKCPTCSTPLDQVAPIGLRDYESWLTGLPGKVSASDLDFCLEQSQTGRVLVMEFKEGSKPLGMGQRLLFRGLKNKGDVDVWVAWERDNDLLVGEMDDTGAVRFTQTMTPEELNKKVVAWWYDGLNP